jgi:hypothetical protein
MRIFKPWWVIPDMALVLPVAISAVISPAHAMDIATACYQGSVGACMLHRIMALFAMLGGWS